MSRPGGFQRAALVLALSAIAAIALLGILWRFSPGFMGWFGLWRAYAAVGLEREQVDVGGQRFGIAKGGDGPALVFLHGQATDKRSFLAFAPEWIGSRRVVLVDLPGHGESGAATAAGTEAAVDQLHALFESEALMRMELVGQGLGGEIALAYSLAHPDRVDQLVLLAPTGIAAAQPSRVDQLRARGADPVAPEDEAGVDRMVALLYGDIELGASLRRQLVAERIALGPAERAFTQPILDEGPVDPSGLTVPTLVLFGSADAVVDPSSAGTVEGIAGVAVEVLDGCPHYVTGDCLDRTLSRMHAFLDD